MQPAQPAPESLPPRKPGAASAASIRASSAGELFSKSSRLEACEADISRPNAATSPAFRASTPWRTRSFSLRTCRARLRPTGSSWSQSASSCSSESHESWNSPRWGILSRKAVRDPIALGAPLVVHPVGQPARGLGVAHHDRRRGLAQGQPVMDQRVAVEEQGMVGPAEQAGELVEQARADADELIFGPPEGLGQLHADAGRPCRA